MSSNTFCEKLTTKKIYNTKTVASIWLNTALRKSMRSDFRYVTFNLFKLFFSNSKVDIPKVLLNLQALSRESNQVTTHKFNNYLMCGGSFLKSLTTLNLSWNDSLNNYFSSVNSSYGWYTCYSHLVANNLDWRTKSNTLNLQQFLNTFIRKSQSIFSLYVYKISKNIYKNTRGKSGKFMFVWKYVPVYKRLFIVTTWLIKELRVMPQRKLRLRLLQLILNMSQSSSQTWAYRVKTFSYNYVYRSCRKTLASTYTSVKA